MRTTSRRLPFTATSQRRSRRRAMPSAELVEQLLHHLADIDAGRCSITDASIEAEPDPDIRQLMVGLLILREDLEYAERQRAQVDADRREADRQREAALAETRIALAARDEFLSIAS